MARLLTLMIAGGLSVVGVAGCGTKSPEGGSPQTGEKFEFSGPSLPTKVKQAGPAAEIDLTVDPSKTFVDTITFSVSDVEGLHFEFQPAEIKPADAKKAKLMVTADATAPLGAKTVQITATPGKGQAVSIPVKVLVDAKEPM